MCGASSISSLVVVSSSVSFAFEVILTAVLCWNSVDRPRAANVPLRRALAKDGVVFFVVRTLKPSYVCHAECILGSVHGPRAAARAREHT
jgi:hypothetical protein